MVRMSRLVGFVTVLFCACLLHATSVSAASGKRLALVIGNDVYQNVSKLEKAGNDASAMAREMKAAGFEVTLERDLNFRNMVRKIEFFTSHVSGGDQVVVFYAGHGVQLRTGSYLLPVDIEANSESEVEKTSYALNDLMDKLSDAKAAFSLVMVDACRDNPLKSSGRSLGGTRGLLPPDPPKGQMVVYSASKGQQALDKLNGKDNNPNGVFTREFIARMKKPGVSIEALVREVQDAVEDLAKTVGHDQRPAMYNEARGNFYFFGPTTVQVQGGATDDSESQTWAAAQQANSNSAYQAYLDAFPQGRYVVAAKIAMEALRQPGAQPSKLSKPTSGKPEDAETAFWNEVKSSGAREYLDAYVKQYPKGKYLALARIELKKIDDQQQQERNRQAAQVQQDDQAAWGQAKQTNTAASYAKYLSLFPQGRYSALAQPAQQRAQIEETQQENLRESQLKQQLVEGAARAEEDAWRKVKAAMDVATVQQFLDDYPSGNNASLAREKLAQMKKLRSEAPAAVFYTVKPGDTLIRIGMEAGQSPSDIARWNGIKDLNKFEVGQVLRVSPTADAVSVPSSNGDDLSLAWPSNGAVIGGFDVVKNKGLEIGGVEGDPVIAAAAGRVVYAGAGLRGYGNLIILKHNSIYLTVYAHNKTLLVREDQTVSKGQQIAEMGNSDADRTKLHFEVRKSGKFVDPSPYLPAR